MSKYISIYKKIKSDILNNIIKPNEKLESKRVLSEKLQVSINTVIQAYNLLLDEGLIISIPKKGYFVIDHKININNTYKKVENEDITYKYDFSTKNIDDDAFPYFTWCKISKNIIYNDKKIISKSSGKGLFELRESISKHLYEAKGIYANPNNIIIGSGIEYLLSIITFLIPAKKYGVENPGYDKVEKILLNNNKNVKYINLDSEGVVIDELNDIEAIYITPENQFPTGIKTSINRRLKLASWAQNKKYIIEDDYDSAFKYLSSSYLSLYSLVKDNTIYLSTFSRSITPGLRISYMILPDSLLSIYEDKFKYYSSTVSTIDQLILNEFISGGYYNRHLNKTKNLYKQKRNKIIEILEQFDFISIDYKNSLLSLIISIPDFDKQKFKILCKENKIDINILDDYYFTDLKSNKIIIGYSGININHIDDGINLLIEIIKRVKF